jgi:uncharacterized protein YbjT (DUF2867 family)
MSSAPSPQARPILVTGAAGNVGGIGPTLTKLLLDEGHHVRAMVRRQDERAEALAALGAEVTVGDLLDLKSMHTAIEGCERVYFGMSVSASDRPLDGHGGADSTEPLRPHLGRHGEADGHAGDEPARVRPAQLVRLRPLGLKRTPCMPEYRYIEDIQVGETWTSGRYHRT